MYDRFNNKMEPDRKVYPEVDPEELIHLTDGETILRSNSHSGLQTPTTDTLTDPNNSKK